MPPAMNSPNIQRLITIFLVLAAITSSSVFLLSNGIIGKGNSQSKTNTAADTQPVNAFAPNNSNSLAQFNVPAGQNSDLNTPTGNLTDDLAASLTRGIIADNPAGPKKSGSGFAPFKTPKNIGSKITDFLDNSPIDALPKVDYSAIKVLKDFSKDDASNYLASMGDILQTLSQNGALNDLKNKTGDANTVNDLNLAFIGATSKVYNLKVPEPFLDYHKTVLGALQSQSSFFTPSTDPLKTYLLVANSKQILGAQKAELKKATDNLKSILPKTMGDARGGKDLGAAIRALTGIETANAQWVVFDILDTIWNALQEVFNALSYVLDSNTWYGKLIVNKLQNELVKAITDKITGWINGGSTGKTQFVSDWKSFLGDAASKAAGIDISKYLPGACMQFQPLLKITLQGPANNAAGGNGNNASDPYAPGKCSLQDMGNNLQNFVNDFRNGDWLQYSQMLKPGGNFWSSYIDLTDKMSLDAAKASQAAQNEAGASGYQAKKSCPASEQEEEDITENGQPVDVTQFQSDPDYVRPGECSGNMCSTAIFCHNQQVDTPPSFINETANKNIGGSSLDRIVNAQDWEGLLTGLLDSVLNKVIDSGKGLRQMNAAALAASGGSTACNGLTGAAKQQCEDNLNNATNAGANNNKNTVNDTLKKYQTSLKDLLTVINDAITGANKALGNLQTASSTCSAALAAITPPTNDSQQTQDFISTNIERISDPNNGQVTQWSKRRDEITTNPGLINKMNSIIADISSGDLAKLRAIAANTDYGGFTFQTTGTEAEQKSDFYSQMFAQLNDAGSKFNAYFGSLSSLASEKGQVQQDSLAYTSTQPGSCGIGKKALLLYQLQVNSRPACSLDVVNNSSACKGLQ